MIHFNYANALRSEELQAYAKLANECQEKTLQGTGAGNDFLGWVELPRNIQNEVSDIIATAEKLRQSCEIIVCIGIGGSYLGAKAVNEFVGNPFEWLENKDTSKVVYAGHHLDAKYHQSLIQVLKRKKFGIICISKSGTTTEPAIAFRLLKSLLEEQVGKDEAKNRIVCITDAKKGALRTLADKEGYKTYNIDDNIGGRFSVLSPVGLLPIACFVGKEVEQLVAGALDMMKDCQHGFDKNISAQYAACRYHLYSKEKKSIEILTNFNPALHFVGEWWKQLFGESEGKEHKGIFPSIADFTTDLHSMGQYIQEGVRHLFETFISIKQDNYPLPVLDDENNLDGLNFLTGKTMFEINSKAELGTMLAHKQGGVPCLQVAMDKADLFHLGALLYFFENACAVSGYMLGVNPFNQPGVEAYKKNMFALLHKPGYEKESIAIQELLNSQQ